jgi:hypothetical protein
VLSLLKQPRDLFSLTQTARDAFAARVALGHICTVFGPSIEHLVTNRDGLTAF